MQITDMAFNAWGWMPLASAILTALALTRTLAKRLQYIGESEQLLIKRLTEKVVINGPGIHFPSYFTTLSFQKRKAVPLTELQYVKIQDSQSGACRVVRGPKLVFLLPYEAVVDGPTETVVLSASQYITVRDSSTGERRVVRGPTTFTPSAFEQIVARAE